jgi:hypothetical protein
VRKEPAVRLLFSLYLLVTLAGLVYFTTVGLLGS